MAFSWRIFLGTFSHKNEEKKSATQSGGSKMKIRKKIYSAKTDPNYCASHTYYAVNHSLRGERGGGDVL